MVFRRFLGTMLVFVSACLAMNAAAVTVDDAASLEQLQKKEESSFLRLAQQKRSLRPREDASDLALPSPLEDAYYHLLSKEPPLHPKGQRRDPGDESGDEDLRGKGPSRLQQFGYAVFGSVPDQPPEASIPVTPDYELGPGDNFTLTLWGIVEGIYELEVSREGDVTLPKAGVVPVAGVAFGELEDHLRLYLNRYYKDFNLRVAMGKLRSMRVYAAGEVGHPGQYHVSAVSTLFHLLSLTGGPTKRGTLRSVQIHRKDEPVQEIDLYAFLLQGGRVPDIPLRDGDTIFIPIIGPTAAVTGNVKRPAIYELRETTELREVVDYAGGILPVGRHRLLQIERVEENEGRSILDIELEGDAITLGPRQAWATVIESMDIVKVLPISSTIDSVVLLEGEVKFPGEFEWREGLRVGDVITHRQLLPTTYVERAEIVRRDLETNTDTVVDVNVRKLLAGDEAHNVLLKPRDVISLFSESRKEMRASVEGEVRRPGLYVIGRKERLSDLLQRTGGFTDQAYPKGIRFFRASLQKQEQENIDRSIDRLELELGRKEATSVVSFSAESAAAKEDERQSTHELLTKLRAVKATGGVIIDVPANLASLRGKSDDLVLQDGDRIVIPARPGTILVIGAVYNPTAVAWNPKMKLNDYLREVGGTTKTAAKKEIHVVRMNGRILSKRFYALSDRKLDPGDVISVPEKVERRGQKLLLFKDISQILFNIGTVSALFLAASL